MISLAPLTLFKTYGDRKIIGNVVLWLFSGNLGLACILVTWLVRNISNLDDYTQFRHLVAKITESLCFWLIYEKTYHLFYITDVRYRKPLGFSNLVA